MDISEAIRTLRLHLKLSQTEFAIRVRHSISSVSNWELGNTIPHKNNVRDIIKRLEGLESMIEEDQEAKEAFEYLEMIAK